MSLLEKNWSTGDVWTSSAITATGGTTLVAAPSAGSSLVVKHLRVTALTATTAYQGGSWGDSAGAGHWDAAGLGPGNLLDIEFTNGWMLGTATALIFNATIGAASSMSLRISALVRTLRRVNP